MKLPRHIVLAPAVFVMLGTPCVTVGEEYNVDPVHSRIGFSVSHLGIAHIAGAFTNYKGTVVYEKGDPASLEAQATIQVESVDTRSDARDKHLRGPDFFDVKKFPEIRFEAGKVETRNGSLYLVGRFTMHGATKVLRLPVTVNGPIDDPWGNQRIGIRSTVAIDRHDYGVGSDKASDKLVGDEVMLKIEIEAIAKNKKGDT